MQTLLRRSSKRRSFFEIATLIEELNGSGQTIAQFAARQGVSPASVYRWKRLVRIHAQGQPENPPVRIVHKVECGATLGALPQDSGIRLHLPNGIDCSLSQDFDGPSLARLLETL